MATVTKKSTPRNTPAQSTVAEAEIGVLESRRRRPLPLSANQALPALPVPPKEKKKHIVDGVLYFDGAAQPNPGIGGAGWILRDGKGKATLKQSSLRVNLDGHDSLITSNQAEYVALIKGLQHCIEQGIRRLEVRGDSQLVIRQCTGQYEVRDTQLKALHAVVLSLVQSFEEIHWINIPRNQNHEADALANAGVQLSTSELLVTKVKQEANRSHKSTPSTAGHGNDQKEKNTQENDKKKEKKPTVQANHVPDYTEQWLTALTKAVGDVAYHVELLHVLQNLSDEVQKLPPSIPPPVRLGKPHDNDKHKIESTGRQQSVFEMSNAFSALFDDDEDDLVDKKKKRQAGNKNNKKDQKKPAASTAMTGDTKAMQVRYLAIRTQCGLAEAYRIEANEHEEQRAWNEVATFWSEAYELLNRTVIHMDPWLAICINDEINGAEANVADESNKRGSRRRKRNVDKNSVVVPVDGHDLKQLDNLLDNVHLVKEDTEREREFALERMQKELQHIVLKLQPLRQDRDVVKARVGENRWKNNPAPKMTYAERIIALAQEKKALEEAIDSVQMLMLAS